MGSMMYNNQYSTDQTCFTGICLSNGVCDFLRPAGYPCQINAQCNSNICNGGSCTNNKNYGDVCISKNSNNTCPSDAVCTSNGTTSYCTKLVGLNQPCNISGVQCGPYFYCDTTNVPVTCKTQAQSTAGQSCAAAQTQCVPSTYCNTTSATCISASTINNQPCTTTCPGPFICLCNGANSQCSQFENLNCDSLSTTALNCLMNNCPTTPATNIYDSQSCIIKNCAQPVAAFYCCILSFNSQFTQYLNTLLGGQFFNCNSNSYVPSSCISPSSGTNLQISLYALFSAIVFVFSFLL